MAEVIYPSTVIEKYLSLVVGNDAFRLNKNSLLKAMGVKASHGNWFNDISSALAEKKVSIVAETTSENILFIYRHPPKEVLFKECKGSTGVDRAITFITQGISSHNDSFYISGKTIRQVFSDGYLTETKRKQINAVISDLGYEVIRHVTGWKINGDVASWELHVCKLGQKNACLFADMERKILSFEIKKYNAHGNPQRLQPEDLSVHSIDWDELKNIKQHHFTPHYFSITDNIYTIPINEIHIESDNVALIESESYERIENVSGQSATDDVIYDSDYDAISYLRKNHIYHLNNRNLSFYIPFHAGNVSSVGAKPNWGIYINLPLFFSSAIPFSDNEFSSSSDDVKKLLNQEKHKSLYWNLYFLFQINYFRYQVESLGTWFEIILHQAGNLIPLYKDYCRALNEIAESPDIEDLAAEYYGKSSFSHFKDKKIESHDARRYKEIISNGNYMSYKNIDLPDDNISANKIASRAKKAIAKCLLGFYAEDNRSLAAVGVHVLNGHATSHKKIDIPFYILGSKEQILTFKRLFPSAKSLLTERQYPSSLKPEKNPLQEISPIPL